jgi:hypothetical protein
MDLEELDHSSLIDESASLAIRAYDLLQKKYEESFSMLFGRPLWQISLADHLRLYLFYKFAKYSLHL